MTTVAEPPMLIDVREGDIRQEHMSDSPQSPIPDSNLEVRPDVAPPAAPRQTARDGSPASRPGDPAKAPQPDGAPIFSTDPLG